jgi:hypothetical protein
MHTKIVITVARTQSGSKKISANRKQDGHFQLSRGTTDLFSPRSSPENQKRHNSSKTMTPAYGAIPILKYDICFMGVGKTR